MNGPSITIVSRSETETVRLAAALARHLRPGDVVTLDGGLGSGKTCFVRGLAAGLGIDPRQVSSPTFVICHEYEVARGEPLRLAHLDGYRLRDPDELQGVGWDDLIASDDTITVVEWPRRLGPAIPAERIDVELAHVDEHSRRLVLKAPRHLADRLSFLTDATRHHAASPGVCPVCGQRSAPQATPFCSERCRWADLGSWLSEGYRITRPVGDEEVD